MAKTKDKKDEFGLNLKGIELLKVQFNHPEKVIPNDTIFKFDISLEQRYNIEKQLIFVVVTIKILMDETLEVGSMKINYIYNLSNFTTLIKNGKIDIPTEIAQTLNSISISTTRGVLYSELKGTFLHQSILPLINPSTMNFIQN